MTEKELIEIFKRSKLTQEIVTRIEKEKKIFIKGLAGSMRALFLASLFIKTKNPIVYISGDEETEEIVRDDLEVIFGGENVTYLPRVKEFASASSISDDYSKNELLLALQQLVEKKTFITVIPAKILAYRFPRAEDFKVTRLFLEVGKCYDFEYIKLMLTKLGFVREYQTESWGEMSIRGGIVDIFPYGSDYPFRIEFFGDTIESIRTFDPITQRSIDHVNEVAIYSQITEPDSDENVKFDNSIFDYLPQEAILFLDETHLIEKKVDEFFGGNKKTPQIFDNKRVTDFFQNFEQIRVKMTSFPCIFHNEILTNSKNQIINFSGREIEPFNGNAKIFQRKLNAIYSDQDSKSNNLKIVFLCKRREQIERFLELFEEQNIDVRNISFISFGLSAGFIFSDENLVVFTENQYYGRRIRWRKRKRVVHGLTLHQLSSLQPGDFVVHVDKGIGIYRGLKKIKVLGHERECLSIEYRDGDMLYVPVEKMDRIQKYSAKEGAVPAISKLGSKDWDRLKKRTKKEIKELARKLTILYAKRKVQKGFAFSSDSLWQKDLEASFEFEDTPDQKRATEDVKQDMEKPFPMDRLICGDVGYGKTEVAIRAAFKAVNDSKQVAVLVPTTILALQHYELFKKRLEKFPIKVEMLSRFRTRSEQKSIIEKLAKGKIDIVIGTHRLLSRDVVFKDLGLLIIDEEHRFGVRKKEQLKEKYLNVDVLTMSATPIPRTLNMGLLGIRDMSLIATAPQNRRPIHTEIVQFDLDLIRKVILKEIDRGGQVFFVHNRVATIEAMANIIRRHVPEIKLAVAHGQMDEKQLEKIMWNFSMKKYHCLVSTMIIESGLDIPNVNTLIVNRADRFGLSQLYQLRGRVGRSNQQAYAYLLVPSIKSLTRNALKRLKIIEQFNELGAGFTIAMRDLEIRGAGNLLGAEQSGHVVALGYDLYTKIINEAIMELKLEKEGKPVPEKPQQKDVRIIFSEDAYLPDDYIQRSEFKVDIYRRLAHAAELKEVEDLKTEVIDRFGRMPKEAQNLFTFVALKLLAAKRNFKLVEFENRSMKCFFNDDIAKTSDRELFQKEISWIIDKPRDTYQFIQGKGEEFGVKIFIPESIRDVLAYGKEFLMDEQEKNIQHIEKIREEFNEKGL